MVVVRILIGLFLMVDNDQFYQDILHTLAYMRFLVSDIQFAVIGYVGCFVFAGLVLCVYKSLEGGDAERV